MFTLVCFPSELVGSKPRRLYVKAIGGTLDGLRESLRERLELEDDEFTITIDGAQDGHFVQVRILPSSACSVFLAIFCNETGFGGFALVCAALGGFSGRGRQLRRAYREE